VLGAGFGSSSRPAQGLSNERVRNSNEPMKSKNKRSARASCICVGLCLLPLCVSCRSPQPLVVQTVGPASAGVSFGSIAPHAEGFLKVFSAPDTRHAIGREKYRPHTDYSIYKTDGSVFEKVENSLGPQDEAPALVQLPAGRYKIRANDDRYGQIFVPVVIEPWRTTKVWLEARARDSLQQLNVSNSVCLPDGRIVGWKARESAN